MYQEWILLFISLSMGALSCYVAIQKGRNPYIWFVVGALFGLLGLIGLLLYAYLTEKEKEEEVEIDPFEERCWYYLDSERNQVGPISETEIRKLIENGDLLPSSLVWKTGMDKWEKVEEAF